MAQLAERRSFAVPADALGRACELFDAARVDEEETAVTMAELLRTTGELIDPHTAVGVHAGRASRVDPAMPLVVLATAHPAKFPDAVRRATGLAPTLPPRLADLLQRPERFTVLPSDLAEVQAHIENLVTEPA
jgi:threonine synthase